MNQPSVTSTDLQPNQPGQSGSSHPFSVLTPDNLLDAVEAQGFACDGRVFALNSYENRVYQIGLEGAEPVIAKFYRPQRWSDEQILEEHEFCYELAAADFPVVVPMQQAEQSLFHVEISEAEQQQPFRFALFERRGGRAPELSDAEHLRTLGRYLGRLHAVGQQREFQHRPAVDLASYGYDAVDYISDYSIPPKLEEAWLTLTEDLLDMIADRFELLPDVSYLRAHADCHIGNILWRDDKPNFVDFDDARSAPAIQDLWMLTSGEQASQSEQLDTILSGYELFCHFDRREQILIEPLRTLRMLHHAAWLAKRWDDPAFPLAFPWFNTDAYWQGQILSLREQLAILQEG